MNGFFRYLYLRGLKKNWYPETMIDYVKYAINNFLPQELNGCFFKPGKRFINYIRKQNEGI